MEEFKGVVKSIVFRNPQNGYSVLRILIDGKKSMTTATGILPDVNVGDLFKMTGDWVIHPRFGNQFQIAKYETCEMESGETFVRFLASSEFPGNGVKTAEALGKLFGNDLARIIEEEPTRLEGVVRGFTKARVAKFLAAWHLAHDKRQAMFFLYELGIVGNTAKLLWKLYEKSTEIRVRENPYCLCRAPFEVSFLKADSIAKHFGFGLMSRERIEAAVLQVLSEATISGHVFLPAEILIEKTFYLLGFDLQDDDCFEKIQTGLKTLLEGREIVNAEGGIWFSTLYEAEGEIAHFVRERAQKPKVKVSSKTKAELKKLEKEQGFAFEKMQRDGIFTALENRFSVLTGGPGTGKTTILKGVLRLAHFENKTTVLAAPTGRAAKRMKEVCGEEASTIHRLLLFDPQTGLFAKNSSFKIDADLLIVDEFSMVDTELCCALFRAIPWNCSVLLVGDADQLPCIGPGNILRELVLCRNIPVIQLHQIFRQKGNNDIAELAGAVNGGRLPSPLDGNNFHFLPYFSAEQGQEMLLQVISEKIPKVMQLDVFQDLQILVPMRKGPLGTQTLNPLLQKFLNPEAAALKMGGSEWRIGDRVMQIKNNYDKNIFNGDVGFVIAFTSKPQTLSVDFDGRTVKYDSDDIQELVQAYAGTVHKSQGSEYPAVILILDASHARMLRRNLLYTAITRAKGHVWILASEGALRTAVLNNKDDTRYTHLKLKIEQEKS